MGGEESYPVTDPDSDGDGGKWKDHSLQQEGQPSLSRRSVFVSKGEEEWPGHARGPVLDVDFLCHYT